MTFNARHLFACLPLFFAIAPSAQAQLSPNSDAEIIVTSDLAELQEQKAIWTGNVRIVQEESILTANRIEANITEDGAVEQIVATGSVRYSNGQEAITGERAVYDEANRSIRISRNVIVTRGKQVLSAGAVTYWIDTGRVKFIPEPGQRIRGVFYADDIEEN